MVERTTRPKPVSRGERLTDWISLGILTRVFPRDLIDEVIATSGKREKRIRSLPAHVMVYYVLALALFFGDGYEEVMRRLVGGLRFMRTWSKDWTVPSTSAIAQARARLEEAPLKELFRRAALPMAKPTTRGAWYGSWRVMAIDGVVLDVPDTAANAEEFGYSTGGRGDSAFPQVRIVGLAECGTHAIVAAAVGASSCGEHTLVADLVLDVQEGMLVLHDRGFYSYRLWSQMVDTGADVVFRTTSKLVLPVLQPLSDGSFRSVLLDPAIQRQVRKKARRLGGSLDGDPDILAAHGTPCRVIEYSIGDGEGTGDVVRLITSILDPDVAPAFDVASLYHQRWEIELTLDEIEVHQIGHGRVLRSKSPEMVRQEIWGILLTHYAIRHLMLEAADAVDIDPDRLSFIRSLRLVRRYTTDQTAFSPSPA